jgi:hypothetical protein
VGSNVLFLADCSGSPRTGYALSLAEGDQSKSDAASIHAAAAEDRRAVARTIEERRGKAWRVKCNIQFSEQQMRKHFAWPDAVFTADFELMGVLLEASITDSYIRVQPVAIQKGILQL